MKRILSIAEEVMCACYNTGNVTKKEGAVKGVENYCSKVMVNGKEAEGLYDTGASCTAVKEHLVRPEMYTKKWVTCILADGRKARYPTASRHCEQRI